MSASAKPIANTRSGTGIPTARLITWWVIASEIVIFGGLLATYIMHRIGASGMGGGRVAHADLGGSVQYVRASHLELVRRAGS